MKTITNKAVHIGGQSGKFVFALERDPETTYEVPLIQDLPAKQVRSLSKAGTSDGVDLLFDLFDELAPGLTDVATQRELSLVMEAWSDASNATLGES